MINGIEVPASVTFNGHSYSVEEGTISHVLNGFESHGINAWGIQINFGGSGQSTGSYRNSVPELAALRRKIEHIFGVSTIDDLIGEDVLVLRLGESKMGRINGLAHPSNPTNAVFLP